jgi:hypothetical protein
MSIWEEQRSKRNRQSLARLTKAMPRIFPSAVLSRALSRPFVPPTPRLAIDSYWAAHPIRADRLARALAARSGAPSSWNWSLGNDRKKGLPATFRIPPAPYRERAYAPACKRVAAAKPADVFGRAAEVDHRVPLFRVWNECRDDPWPKLLDYWGLPNLQVINRDVHTAKCATEARDRRTARYLTSELP